eukprot:PITA_01988
MKDFGQMHYFIGLEFWQQKGEIFHGQGRYATEILKRFRMEDCRSMATPMITNCKNIDALEYKDVDPTLYRKIIGSLMYVVNARPDICYVVNTLTQFMVEPKREHYVATKHVLSRKQNPVALSSFEVDYMVVSIVACEEKWVRKLIVSLFRIKMEVTRIMCDNQSCIKLYENPRFHDRSKHIDIWCRFVRDYVQSVAVHLSYTPIGKQLVDILTKALGRTKFDYFREKMGMLKNPFQ